MFLITAYLCVFIPKKVEAIPEIKLEKNHTIPSENLSKRDFWTQHFFDLIRPELINQELESSDVLYHREKLALSKVVTYVLSYTCQQANQNKYYILTAKINSDSSDKYPRYRYYPRGRNRNLYNRTRRAEFNQDNQNSLDKYLLWKLNRDYFFDGLYEDLTDAVFYARHPEISQEETKLQHLNWAAEWNFIRRHFANYNQEEILKRDFIPICNTIQEQN